MTTSDARTSRDTAAGAHAAALATLPLHPWTDLRAATGMLLGADDFEVLMGNPRGKHMLHNAWMHGRGVVWGFGVRFRGEWDVEVCPGLAVDGWGRELHLDAPRCVSLRPLLEADHDPTCGTRQVELHIVIQFDPCLDKEVEALVDPCDVTRQTTDHSRVVERIRIEVVRGRPPVTRPGYHRVRVLLGLDRVGTDDEAGAEATRCREEVSRTSPSERARALLYHFRCLAALDAADWRPLDSDCSSELFPVDADKAGVLLGCVTLTVTNESDCPVIVGTPELDTCRPTVLPTTVVQDLVCALAPGLIGTDDKHGSGQGPQVIAEPTWSRDPAEHEVLHIPVTADLVPGSVRRAVQISSLSDTAWIAEDLEGPPRYDPESASIAVTFADRPKNPTLRILILGTGNMPVYGANPKVPLAGVRGEDPGTGAQGRDAVLTIPNPFLREE
ncbi:hypothetical protein EV649_5084 [Kribbella sp. VKM Ac-2569]|uniref:hypothetical protein n=1 Tax=Kribbella sp. VKM Ac-2569 TaxID=2512220 RepID=UPI00102AB739|nr:hypothetical protein [Kribbella sp. VKM Ac-2569]RZT17537.1 hypothetical protein EV649_5084 [Kribbella sp. VKM Ac-2569]